MVHPIHLVDHSPWPLQISITQVTIIVTEKSVILNMQQLSQIALQWFRDILREGKKGEHTKYVQKGLTLGYFLFLISEIMLFFSFFWAYFHSSLAPNIELGLIWPPLGIQEVNPWGIPFQGSTVLLCSGFVVTLSHHAQLLGNKRQSEVHQMITILQGALFLYLQYTEYSYGEFTIADSVFGSIFYMTTGQHAIHVMIGTLFLLFQCIRQYQDHMTIEHHLGYEFAIFYWHQVDIIWLYVFLTYYWWGSV